MHGIPIVVLPLVLGGQFIEPDDIILQVHSFLSEWRGPRYHSSRLFYEGLLKLYLEVIPEFVVCGVDPHKQFCFDLVCLSVDPRLYFRSFDKHKT